MLQQPNGENLHSSIESGGLSSCCFRSPREEEIVTYNKKNVKIVLVKKYPHFIETPNHKKVGSNEDLGEVYQSLAVESTQTSKSQKTKKPQMSPYVVPSKPVSTPKQKQRASDFLNHSKSNIEFEANSSQRPRVNNFFFTPNLRKSLQPEDKKLQSVKFNLYTTLRGRTKSLEKLELSLSKSRLGSKNKLDSYQTSLVKFTHHYRATNFIETPKNSAIKCTKNLSQYLTPQNNQNLGQIKGQFKKAQAKKAKLINEKICLKEMVTQTWNKVKEIEINKSEMRVYMAILSKEQSGLRESYNHSVIIKPKLRQSVKQMKSEINQYIEQLIKMKQQQNQEKETSNTLREKIGQIQEILLDETKQRDQLRAVVALQRKRIQHKSDELTQKVEQFERSVKSINQNLEVPKRYMHRKITD